MASQENINTQQKSRDYQRYKKYQQKNRNVLELADSNNLNKLSIEELLKNYSIVERIYNLRIEYRSKYFTPENWDEGHEQFLLYLLNVLRQYENGLQYKFLEISQIEELERLTQQTENILISEGKQEVLEPVPHKNLEQEKLMNVIEQKRIDREKFEQEWNLQVQQLRKDADEKTKYVKNTITLIHKALQNEVPQVNMEETIDFIHYFQGCINMTLLNRTRKVIPKQNIHYSRINPYPRSIDDYSYEYRDNTQIFINIYRFIVTPLVSELLKSLLDTILEITKITTNYYILSSLLTDTNIRILFPTITIDVTKITTQGKTCLAVKNNNEFFIYHFKSNIFESKFTRAHT